MHHGILSWRNTKQSTGMEGKNTTELWRKKREKKTELTHIKTR
jgi:hypothetical protein